MRAHRPTGNAGPIEKKAAARAVPVSPPLSPDGLLARQRAAGNAAVARHVQQALASPGRPLADPLRSEMEARLGAGFSDVRLHTGAAARRSAAELGARAYTSGDHVVIGDGPVDERTLAHELTHVVQQRQGPVAGTDNGAGLRISHPHDRDERAAEENALRATSGPTPVSGGTIDTRLPSDRLASPSTSPSTVQRVIHQEASYAVETGGRTSLTNRGDIDVEEHGGETCVRVYQTVFAPVMSGGRHKDVHQQGDGSVDFRNQKGSAWLNMGRPWRSMHYMRTYQDQKNRAAPSGSGVPTAQTTSLVRSFLVPLETYRQVTGHAVSEQQINSTHDPKNLNQSTDKAKDSDQYEVRGAWMAEVAATAVPNSLVTYAPDGLVVELRKDSRHGRVEPLSSLLGRLGMPDLQDFPEYGPPAAGSPRRDGLVLPLDKGKMPTAPAQKRHVQRLNRLLADAFPKNGNTRTRQAAAARAELKRMCGLSAVDDRDIDWAGLRDRVLRAMNYAGMPAVLAEVYNEASAQRDDDAFPARDLEIKQ
ncbi:eCIS core domain-containing protein [Streptomyces cinnamoneus]|uniref:eCIS core domain-containing protein n=1 Tax=Streptomyces cinnamoneus TaxID=53446 RepID=UPI003F4D663C